jgi:D-sedoheptulose 7-phosphate isomerase
MTTVSGYLDGVKGLIDQISAEAVERLTQRLYDVWREDRRVLTMGNGGSSSTASHIVNDLQKCIHLESGKPIKAMCLSDCTPLVLAWANDTAYDNVYAPQVACWAQPQDLIIAISGSGNSPNIVRAVEQANEIGAYTFGLAGFNGGKLAVTAKECIVVKSGNMQQIEDLHMILLHLVFSILRDRVRA